jgi:hypothetical protein
LFDSAFTTCIEDLILSSELTAQHQRPCGEQTAVGNQTGTVAVAKEGRWAVKAPGTGALRARVMSGD